MLHLPLLKISADDILNVVKNGQIFFFFSFVFKVFITEICSVKDQGNKLSMPIKSVKGNTHTTPPPPKNIA